MHLSLNVSLLNVPDISDEKWMYTEASFKVLIFKTTIF